MALRLLLTLSMIVSSVIGTCYHPDGTSAHVDYKPCNTNGNVSMCCHLGVSNNNGDACGSGPTYGLCGITGPQLWRESCTDPTWKDPACLKFCLDDKGLAGDIQITTCNDGSFCCGENNATCCAGRHGVVMVNNQPVPAFLSFTQSSISSTSPTLSTTVASSTTTPPSLTSLTSSKGALIPPQPTRDTSASGPDSPNPEPTIFSSSKNLSTSDKTKIAVGVTAGVLALVAIITFGWYMRKRRSAKAIGNPSVPPTTGEYTGYAAELDSNRKKELRGFYNAELDTNQPAAIEKSDGRPIYEM